jgi:hypothetical protein
MRGAHWRLRRHAERSCLDARAFATAARGLAAASLTPVRLRSAADRASAAPVQVCQRARLGGARGQGGWSRRTRPARRLVIAGSSALLFIFAFGAHAGHGFG